MLSKEQQQENVVRFESLINSIQRECNKEELFNVLRNSDFYYAPASTKYHCAFEGGLVYHCLGVYDALVKLNDSFNLQLDPESMIICGLLHDFSKMNFYDKTFMNKKIYSPTGKKSDENGKFDWVSVPGYVTRDSNNRFVFGNHEQTAEFMVRNYIPLSIEESVAILHHMGGMNWDCSQVNIGEIYGKYSLAVALHLADMASTYLVEGHE